MAMVSDAPLSAKFLRWPRAKPKIDPTKHASDHSNPLHLCLCDILEAKT